MFVGTPIGELVNVITLVT